MKKEINEMKITKWYRLLKNKRFIIHIALSLISNAVLIIVPLIMGQFLNIITYKSITLMYKYSYYYLLLVAILVTVNFYLNMNFTIMGKRSEFKTKSFIYNKLLKVIDYKGFDNKQAGYLANRIENDSNTVVNFILNENVNLFFNIASVVVILVILFNIDYLLTIIIILLLVSNSLVYFLFKKALSENSYKVKEANSIFFNQQNEFVENIKSIKRNSWNEIFGNRLSTKFTNLYNSSIYSMKIGTIYSSLNTLIQNLINTAIMLICGYRIINNSMSIGTFLIFSNYMSTLMKSKATF